MPAAVAQTVPLAAWDLQAEEWFFLANRKCHVGKSGSGFRGGGFSSSGHRRRGGTGRPGAAGEGHRGGDAPAAPRKSRLGPVGGAGDGAR